MTPAPHRPAIEYDRQTKDFAVFVEGREIGRAQSYREGEQLIERELRDHGRQALDAHAPEKLALTVAEVATALGLAESSVRDYIRAGRIPAIRVGRHIRVSVAAL